MKQERSRWHCYTDLLLCLVYASSHHVEHVTARSLHLRAELQLFLQAVELCKKNFQLMRDRSCASNSMPLNIFQELEVGDLNFLTLF